MGLQSIFGLPDDPAAIDQEMRNPVDDQPRREESSARQPQQQGPRAAGLFPCPDCQRQCSRLAESCPQCGRFFQRLGPPVKVERDGWVSTITNAILLAALLPVLAAVVLVFLLLAGALGAGAQR